MQISNLRFLHLVSNVFAFYGRVILDDREDRSISDLDLTMLSFWLMVLMTSLVLVVFKAYLDMLGCWQSSSVSWVLITLE